MGKKGIPDFIADERESSRGKVWKLGRYELDEVRRELRLQGQPLLMEPKPLNLLMLLVRHPGELLTKDELMDALWTGRIVTDSVLARCVARLRQALGEDEQDWVRTVHGYGYRYDGPIDQVSEEAAFEAPPSLEFQPGQSLAARPNWLLQRRLGKSGDAWLAEHAKTRKQRVYKFSQSASGLSSLKREVTIYRLLRESLGNKDCCVEIIDWNFDEPPWFIETTYCPGGSLQEWLEAQGGVLAVPLQTRIDLVIQIADALAAVHALGVLHKDLKPANILIVPDGSGAPCIRLGDFGSGRLLDPNRLDALAITRMGFTQLADESGTSGTPLYYAPEIIAGRPFTVQGDIYALGVILFQLIVGSLRRQLAPGWEREIDDPMLRQDIAAAAEGDPAKRLTDAALLAESLRQLEQRRHAAERAEREERELEAANRAMERMRARRSATVAAFAILLLGLASSTTLYLKARAARERAELEARHAQAVTDFLNKDMLAGIDANQMSLRDLSVKQLLDRGAAEVDHRFNGQPEVAATIHETLGRSYWTLEFAPQAAENFHQAEALYAAANDPGLLPQRLRLAAEAIKADWAEALLDKHLPGYDALHAQGRRQLGEHNPDVLTLGAGLAGGRIQLGHWRDSAATLRQMLPLTARDPSLRDLHQRTLGMFAYVELEQGEYRDAVARLDELQGLIEHRYGRRSAAMATLLWRRALGELRSGQLERASGDLAEARSLTEYLSPDDSSAMYAIRLYEGMLLIEKQKFDEASHELEALVNEVAALDQDNAIDQGYTEKWPLSEALMRAGHLEQAARVAQQAYDSASATLGAQHPRTLGMRARLARIRSLQGDDRETEALLALPEPLQQFPEVNAAHPYNIDFLEAQALASAHHGDAEHARALRLQALQRLEQRLPSDHWRVLDLHRRLDATPHTTTGA